MIRRRRKGTQRKRSENKANPKLARTPPHDMFHVVVRVLSFACFRFDRGASPAFVLTTCQICEERSNLMDDPLFLLVCLVLPPNRHLSPLSQSLGLGVSWRAWLLWPRFLATAARLSRATHRYSSRREARQARRATSSLWEMINYRLLLHSCTYILG